MLGGKENFMEGIIYLLIFMMGTVFGSFFTLAVHRIPLGLDIAFEHSFCPRCNTKLKTKDLIPVLSYLFLGGKCRYCGEKIRIRYLMLELLSGFTFLAFALSLHLDFSVIEMQNIIYFAFFILYFTCLFMIAGIDYEKNTIQKSVLLFGMIISICYMIYVCIANQTTMYTYIIALAGIAILLIIDMLFLKKKLEGNYTVYILMLSMLMIAFSGGEVFYYTVALSLLMISIKMFMAKIKEMSKKKVALKEKQKEVNVPIGFFLAVSNIFLIILASTLAN